MTDYVWPVDIVPSAVSFFLQPHTGGSESPFSRRTKVYGLSAPRWTCSMTFRVPDSADRWSGTQAEWGERIDAFLDKLQGRLNRAILWDFRREGRFPTTFENAAITAGSDTVALTNAAVGDIRVGEYIGGDGRPHRITEVYQSGSGLELKVKPPFRSAINPGEAEFVRPAGAFRLASDDENQNGSSVGELTQYTLNFVEDLADSLDGFSPASVLNLTDGASISYTATNTSDGVEISGLTANKSVLFSTGIRPGRVRIILNVEPTVAGGINVGLGFKNATGAYLALGWSSIGWIIATHSGYSGAPASPIMTTPPTFVTGDKLRLQYDITGDGKVYLTLSKNGGARYNVGVTAPVGEVYLFMGVGGADSATYSLIQQPVATPAASPTMFGGTASGTLRAPPSGFTLPSAVADFRAYKAASGRLFSTNVDLQPPLAEDDHTVFIQRVDPLTGNDTYPGGIQYHLKTLREAFNRTKRGRTIIKPAPGLYNFDTSFHGPAISPEVAQIIGVEGYNTISSMHQAGLSWSLDSGSNYQATFTDFVANVFDAANLTSDGDYGALELAPSLASCRSTPNRYFVSGTTVYVHTFDNRVPDANIRVYKDDLGIGVATSANFYWAEPGTMYFENIQFEGGPWGVVFGGVQSFYARDCTFKYASIGAGVGGASTLTILQGCVIAWNAGDGIAGGAASLEIDCISRWNGRNVALAANNNSSNHGGVSIRVKTQNGWGDYHHAEHRGIHDIHDVTSATSWHLGITSRDSRNGYSNFAVGNGPGTPKMWLDTCTSSGATNDLEAATGATMYHFDLVRGATDTGAGTITTYTP